MAKDMNAYLEEAKKRYEGDYGTRLQELERLKNEKMSAYDTNNSSIESQYKTALDDNTKAGVQRVNSYNNNTLSRGLGRSTIATTGIAGIENQTANSANSLNQEKLSKLADITSQRNNYLSDYDRGVQAINAEKQGAIQKYAQDLYNKDLDWERQVAEQIRQEQWKAEQERIAWERQQQLAAQQAAARSYSSGGSGGYSSASDVSNAIENDVVSSIRSGDLNDLAASKNRVESAYQQGYLSDSAYSKYIGNINSSYDLNNRAQQKVNQGTYGYSTAGAYNKPKNTSTSTSNKKTGTSAINYKYVNGKAVRV